MRKEINLLKNYPSAKRNLDARSKKTTEDQSLARQFGKDFFDGDRKNGYGGFNYNPKYWGKVVEDFKNYWQLSKNSSVLDVGCAKGFMIYDFLQLIPGLKIYGIDVSSYAIENSKNEVSQLLKIASADNLPFKDNSFDYVISINTIHNLDKSGCKKALQEITRVSRKDAFITVDAYNTPDEKERMLNWNLTAKTIMSTSEWKNFFEECKYEGDYYWFIP